MINPYKTMWKITREQIASNPKTSWGKNELSAWLAQVESVTMEKAFEELHGRMQDRGDFSPDES